MEPYPCLKLLLHHYSYFHFSGATPNDNEKPQVKILSAQSALVSLSVAYMKMVVGAVEKVAFQHFCSSLLTVRYPSNSHSADKVETNYAIHRNLQYTDGMDGCKVEADEEKTHLSDPLYMVKWKNMPLPFVPPIFLYDQASLSLTSQEWCPRVGCGKENICYSIKTAHFKPCYQTYRFYE